MQTFSAARYQFKFTPSRMQKIHSLIRTKLISVRLRERVRTCNTKPSMTITWNRYSVPSISASTEYSIPLFQCLYPSGRAIFIFGSCSLNTRRQLWSQISSNLFFSGLTNRPWSVSKLLVRQASEGSRCFITIYCSQSI